MSIDIAARRRAARRHWIRVLSGAARDEYWPADGDAMPAPDGPARVRLDDVAAARLAAVTRGDAVLLHAVFAAALAVCLSARRGHDTVVLGVPPLLTPDGAGTVTVLPVPVRVARAAARKEHLLATRQALLEAYDAQDVDPDWLAGHAPALTAGDGDAAPAGWLVRHPAIHAPVPAGIEHDGLVEIHTDGDAVEVCVTGGPQHRAAAAVLAAQLARAAGQMVTDAGATVATITRTGEHDLAAAVAAAQAPDTQRPDPLAPASDGMFGLVRAVAGRVAGPAVVAHDATLTYPELVEQAEAVARGLLADGKGGTVALHTGQSAATVVGALAALRAGMPYVVVPPDVAGDGPLLRERGITISIVEPAADGSTPGRVTGGPATRTIGQLAGRGRKDDAPAPPASVDGAAVAYVLYTSGTTGAAKAVAVTHDNLLASTAARRAVHGAAPRTFLLLSPFHFDSSVAGLYATLTTGGTLHVVPAADLAEPAALAEHAHSSGAQATLGLPRVLAGLLHVAGALPHLELVIGAGEVFPADLAPLVRRCAPQAQLVNEYGPSEATVWATWHDVTDDDGGAGGAVPIGRPVPGTAVYVLDARGEPLPAGQVGELAIGGPQVAARYQDDEQRTAARFVTAAFAGGGRLYLTGDQGWAGPDGVLHYVGRGDDEVKVRGARVTLADVAAVFREQSAVGDAEALLDRDQLVVFTTPAPGQSLDPGKVLDAARGRLAAHAVPGRVVAVPEIPRLSNGKIDRAVLLRAARQEQTGGGRAPADAVEELTVELFRSTLVAGDAGGVDMDSNFFTLGGDSIKAALLIAQLSRRLSSYVYVVALLDHPTPARLAAFLRANYADALTAGDPAAPSGAAVSGATEEAAELLRPLLRHVTGPAPRTGAKLPRAVFVLAPPRSGTTLLRIMLGGHPGLFSPPELELLQFDTLDQRAAVLSGRAAFYQEGLLRAVMALRGCDADAAGGFLAERTAAGWTVPQMYAWLAEQAAGRILVDKTTAYGLDPGALRRAEELFDEPLYIHLSRHPQACIASFVEARLDQVYLRAEHGLGPADAAELTWRLSHEHISAFLDGVDAARVHHVQFEELVADPATVARELADFIGVEFDERMLDVHGNQQERMSDGVRAGGRMLGDIKFHEHSGISRDAAARWREKPAVPLHPRTVHQARELGYTPDGFRRNGPLPSSPRWDWLLEMMRPGTSMLNVPLVIAGDGPLDLDAVAASVRTLARRHHAFRSVVITPEAEPVLQFRPDLQPALTVEQVPAGAQPARADALAQARFDLETDSPLRVHVLLDGTRFTLVFVVHHVAADAWSLRVLVQDFLTAYGDHHEGRPPALPPLPRQPVDVADDEAGRDEAAVTAATERIRDRLDGVEWALHLPPHRDPAPGVAPVASLRAPLPDETAAAVRRYAAERGCSLYRVLLSAFGWTLQHWTGDRDFCVGTPSLNRGPADDRTIGLFVTTALVRVDLTGDDVTFDEIVQRSERAVRDAIADATVPFEDVVGAVADRVGPGRPLLQVLFSAQELDLSLDQRPELRLRRVPMLPRQAKFDIGFIVADEDGKLIVNADLDTGRFAPADVGTLVADFTTTIQALVDDPGAPLRPARVAVGGVR